MPNLKIFKLNCYSKDIDESFYKKLIKKILLLNLNYIYLSIKKDFDCKIEYYTLKELNELFPDLNLLKINNFFMINKNI